MFGQLKELLFDVEGATTSAGADLAELSDETLDVEHPDKEEHDQPLEEVPEETRPEEQDEVEEVEEIEEIEEKPPTETTHPFDRPSIKQLEEAFPGLLKKFPSLRDMYFRESEYTKIFPTIDEAKEANDNNVAFTNIRDDVFQGDGSKFFAAIKEADEKGLERFSSQVLGTLFKVSPNSFWRATQPLVEDIARSMFAKGVKAGDESMQNAARYLSDYYFGDVAFAEGKKTSVVKLDTDPEISKQREEFEREKDTSFRGGVESSVKSQLVSLIESKDEKTGKLRLDPDGVFSPFIKSTIIDHIIRDLGTQLTADKDHIRFMDSLWTKARRSGRTDEDKARIISAYLARAKSLIPSLRSKYVSEALGTKVKTSVKRKELSETSESRRESGSQGRSSNGGQKNYNPKSINFDKTSDEDILNDNITYK